MKTLLQILSEDELTQIHERTLRLLAETGVRVDTRRGRQLLSEAGAQANEDTKQVRFPRPLVEECLRLAGRDFTLGGRRPGWSLRMNRGGSSLILDGGAIHVYDAVTDTRRQPNMDDWLRATRTSDALDDFGCFWSPVEGCFEETPAGTVAFIKAIFENFSKHVQESFPTPKLTRWALEAMEIIFGSREAIRRRLPFSFLLCPESPLVIGGEVTDAYLETSGWGIPAASMSMPLLGMTGPGTLISHLILCNCETLATLCLVQAAEPGTPFIYAPVPAVANPRSGRYGGGEVEHALLGAAVTQIARYYRLSVETSAGGTDQYVPGIQAGYENGSGFLLPVLADPDLLVGPGSLGGSTVFCLEQLLIDVEMVRRCKRLAQGIGSADEQWLEAVIAQAGPGGNFLAQPSTRSALRGGEVYIGQMGMHDSYERWQANGKASLLEEARARAEKILAKHERLPLGEEVEGELERLERRARQVE